MIRVLEWNVGYETADTRKLRHNLPWVRVTVPLADLRWAKLWSLEDAAKIWSGWMALVFCASQSAERGTVESVESVSLLSRVPVGMVQAGLDWAVANGMAELSDDRQKDSGKIPDDSEKDSGLRTYVRDGTLRDETNKAARVREPGQASRISAKEWTPDSSHAGICAVRNLSMELQLERFRATATGATGAQDTPEGWSRRFMAWIAKGRPEPAFSPAIAGSETHTPEWVVAKVDGYRDEIRRHAAEIERLEEKRKTTTLTQAATDKLAAARVAVNELREKIKKLGIQP